jgi:hypothetical protein
MTIGTLRTRLAKSIGSGGAVSGNKLIFFARRTRLKDGIVKSTTRGNKKRAFGNGTAYATASVKLNAAVTRYVAI